MRKITFYRQKRIDGGIRTGVEVGGNTVLSRFENGRTATPDPALLWFVDVICEGRSLPQTTEQARQWLARNEKTVRRLIDALASRIAGGVDPGDWPVHEESTVHGVKIRISCSAVRRIEARKLAETLRDVAENWSEYVGSLAPV